MNDNTRITVRPFTYDNLKDVIAMDNESGNCVHQLVEDLKDTDNDWNDYSWGIYVDNILAGYCTIGYADADVWDAIENHPLHNENSYLLSDVYVKPEYRHHGYALALIKETIKGRFIKENKQPVFLETFNERLSCLYEKAGFEVIPNTEDEELGCCCMVYDPNK